MSEYFDGDFWERIAVADESKATSSRRRALILPCIRIALERAGASDIRLRLTLDGAVSCDLSIPKERMGLIRTVLNEECVSHKVRVGCSAFRPRYDAVREEVR